MRMRIRLALLLMLLPTAVAGCSRTLHTAGSTGDDGPLLPSIQVYTEDESVNFVLQITNTAIMPVELEFPNGQSFDFLVLDEGGREVWKWSSGHMFTQAEREETLAAGASLRYEGEWSPASELQGNFVAVGRLTARNLHAEQSTRFRLR